jgi:hypothetical protein
MFDALSYRSWMESLDAYVVPCLDILNPILGPRSNICLAMLSKVEVR